MATPAPKKAVPSKSAPAKPVAKAAPPKAEVAGEAISAKLSTHDQVLTVNYDFGTNLDEAVDKFGAETVFNCFKDAAVIKLQALLRRKLTAALVGDKDGKTTDLPEDVQELVADWKPSASGTTRKSAAEKVETIIGKMSEEERAALIAKLQAGE